MKAHINKFKYQLLSFGIMIISAIVVVLMVASSRATKDKLFDKYVRLQAWRNTKLSQEIDREIEKKKEESDEIGEEISEIEEELLVISKKREESDALVETISYRDLSELLSRVSR